MFVNKLCGGNEVPPVGSVPSIQYMGVIVGNFEIRIDYDKNDNTLHSIYIIGRALYLAQYK